MISLLAGIFIKDKKGDDLRTAYGMLCGIVGIILNIIMFVIKFFAGILSGAISITADSFNNLSDALSSVITLLGFKLSAMKPDAEHPFGHGRYEYIAGLIVSMFIILMGAELAQSTTDKILHPDNIEFSIVIAVILSLSILIKLYMSFYNKQIAAKIDSAALKATASDSLSDAIATTVVLAATIISRFSGVNIDGWCGVAVAVMIIITGIKSARDTINPLLGTPPSPELVNEIKELVMSYPEIIGIHDLMVHDYGPGRFTISLHAEVSEKGNMLEMHDTIDNIERNLNEKFKCISVIHMDPIVSDDENVNHLRMLTADIVREIDKNITIHDFRIVSGQSHTNLIYDAIIPYDCKLTNSEIAALIKEKTAQLPGNYYAVVRLEKAFSS